MLHWNKRILKLKSQSCFFDSATSGPTETAVTSDALQSSGMQSLRTVASHMQDQVYSNEKLILKDLLLDSSDN